MRGAQSETADSDGRSPRLPYPSTYRYEYNAVYTIKYYSDHVRTRVHVDEAIMGLSVHADGDGEGDNPLLEWGVVYD